MSTQIAEANMGLRKGREFYGNGVIIAVVEVTSQISICLYELLMNYLKAIIYIYMMSHYLNEFH